MELEQHRLGDLIQQVRGMSYKKEEISQEPKSDFIPVLRANNISNDFTINYDNVVYIKKERVKDEQILRKGDILIAASSGSLKIVGKGAQFIQGTEVTFGAFCKVIRPIDDKVNPRLIGYYFQSEHYRLRISSLAQGANIKNLKNSHINDLDLKVPSATKSQKQLVEILDKTQALINKRKTSIKLLDELLIATFLDLFGDPILNPKQWGTCQLDDLGNWKSGGTPLRSKVYYFDGDIPWFSSGELNDIYVQLSNEHISDLAIKESSAKLIEAGSLLVGMYDTAALKSSITKINASCNQAISFAKLDENKCNSEYVYFAIQIGREFHLTKRRGVRQRNLNLQIVKDLEIPLPPKKLQDEFGGIVESIVNLKVKLKENDILDLFRSSLQKAFLGELEIADFTAVQLELSKKRKSINWFVEQIKEVKSDNWVAIKDKWDDVSMSWDELQTSDQLDKKLNDLELPTSGSIQSFEERIEQGGIPSFKHVDSLEQIERIQSDPLIHEMGLSDGFKIPAYEERITQRFVEEELKRDKPSELDILEARSRFIEQFEGGKINIGGNEINLLELLDDQYGQEEFSLNDVIAFYDHTQGLGDMEAKEVRKHLYQIISSFLLNELNDTYFQFDTMREVLQEKLFNPDYKLLKEYVFTQIKEGYIKQVYYPWTEKEPAPAIIDIIKQSNGREKEKTGIHLYIDKSG